MNQESFDTAFEQITKAQKMVLKLFLVGKNDEAIAQTLHLDSSTIRRHIANICSIFGFKNQSGERFSYRQELIEIFTKFKPDLVGLDLHQEVAPILEFPDVQVPLNSRFYIERPPIESNCDREILLPGTLILIKAPKLMGKTSLLTRIIAHATQQDLRTVQLNMRLADRNNLTDIDLDKLLATAATETGIYSSHLNRLTLNLQQNIQLFELFKSIVDNPMNIFKLDKIQVYKLHGMGAIKIVDNIVQPSCDLYRQYFYNSN